MPVPFPIRKECPPGACVCQRDTLLDDPQADMRILQLSQAEEKKLIARLGALQSLAVLHTSSTACTRSWVSDLVPWNAVTPSSHG
ncbi:hypothetical protein [Rhodoferax sp.]|uniref:hypothetical protein n=1 Tax=Rhodoferax sp. TaxID=50421 RepID=UPI00374CCDC2